MLGKIAAAIIGDKLAGKNEGGKGAVLGVVAATVAKKAIPTVAAVAILGYAAKKAKDYFGGGGERA
jgi:hypothetical protein